jgi:SPP1 gp7 family putative phage head morphogenesis protein
VDERQARLLIRQAFREQDLTVRVTNAADAALMASLQRVADLIKGLPAPGDLLREQAWRKLKPQIMQELDRYANELGRQTLEVLKGEVEQAEVVARAFVPVPKPGGAEAFGTVWMGDQIRVTSGDLYYRALSKAGVAGQSFREVFGTSLDKAGGILTVGQERTGLSRFFMTSIDRVVTRGLLEGKATPEMAQELIQQSLKGLNLGVAGKTLRANATTVVRTAIIDANARAREAFWDANDEDIVRWYFDALSDSRTCPWCAMYDQKEAKSRDELPKVPVHPRCRCQVLPLTKAALLLREEDRKDGTLQGGSAVELFKESELPGRRDGESVKDFIQRKRREREAAIAAGKDLPERWYATPVKKDGVTYWRRARDLPPTGKSGVMNVPQWLATTNKTTQIDFFGGGGPGALRQQRFEQMIGEGLSPREALARLLSADGTARNVKRYRFKTKKELAK